jgi:hypothetical protein
MGGFCQTRSSGWKLPYISIPVVQKVGKACDQKCTLRSFIRPAPSNNKILNGVRCQKELHIFTDFLNLITKTRNRKVSLKAGMLGSLKERIFFSLQAFWPHSFPAPCIISCFRDE